MPEFTAPLFSTKLLFGRRTLFFDVRKTKDDKPYVRITESTVKAGQKQRINLTVFESELDQFKHALTDVFGFVETIK